MADTMLKDTKVSRVTATLEMAGTMYKKTQQTIQTHGYIGDGRHYVQKYTANYTDSRLQWRWQTPCTKMQNYSLSFEAPPKSMISLSLSLCLYLYLSIHIYIISNRSADHVLKLNYSGKTHLIKSQSKCRVAVTANHEHHNNHWSVHNVCVTITPQ